VPLLLLTCSCATLLTHTPNTHCFQAPLFTVELVLLLLQFQFHFSPFCLDFLAFLLLLAGAVAATASGFAATATAAAAESFEPQDGGFTAAAAAAAAFDLKDAFLAGDVSSAFTAIVAAGAAAATAGVPLLRAVCYSNH
jgi:hypothetical protein